MFQGLKTSINICKTEPIYIKYSNLIQSQIPFEAAMPFKASTNMSTAGVYFAMSQVSERNKNPCDFHLPDFSAPFRTRIHLRTNVAQLLWSIQTISFIIYNRTIFNPKNTIIQVINCLIRTDYLKTACKNQFSFQISVGTTITCGATNRCYLKSMLTPCMLTG